MAPCHCRSWCLVLCAALLLGCGGGEGPRADRGVVAGKGTVDASVPDPLESLSSHDDWPVWRGPARNGIAEGQSVPTDLGPDNLLWKVQVPGRGHASPTVVGDRIYLATAAENAGTQSVVAFDRDTGDRLWVKPLHSGGLGHPTHPESSHASGTVACDGQRLFVAFLNHDKIHVTALDLDGNVLWQKKAGGFDSKFGYAPSPTLYKSSVIVAADHQAGGHITSWDRSTGELNWRIERPAVSTYASPLVLNVGGRDQLLIAGANKLASYDPLDGSANWAASGTAEACVGTVVAEGDVVFASGGHPQSETIAVDATTGDVLWRNRVKCYVSSMLPLDGFLYAVDDDGTAHCIETSTGEEIWRERLGQTGKIRSSPLLAGGRIYITSSSGELFVIDPNPTKLDVVSKTKLADESYASPVACGNHLYLRVADESGGRQEWLCCYGDTR
jgi:outer membrane protein assembly factor BamB